jgi:hypothetical protein
MYISTGVGLWLEDQEIHPLDRSQSVEVSLDVKDASVEEYICATQRYVRGFRGNAQFVSGKIRTDAELRPSYYYLTFRAPYEDKERPHGYIDVSVSLETNTVFYVGFDYDHWKNKIGESLPLCPKDFSALLKQVSALAESVRAQKWEPGILEQDVFFGGYTLSISSDRVGIEGWSVIRTSGKERARSEESYYFRVKDGLVVDPESGGMTWEQFYDRK